MNRTHGTSLSCRTMATVTGGGGHAGMRRPGPSHTAKALSRALCGVDPEGGPRLYDTAAMTDPTPSLATPYRTHTCGQLRAGDAGTDARLAGWVHRRRDHGQLIFLDLRDRHGITQVVDRPGGRAGRPRGRQPGPPGVRRVGPRRGRAAPGRDREREAADRRHRAPGDRAHDPVRIEDAAVLHQRPRRPGRREPAAQVPLSRHPPRADAAAPAAAQPDGPGDPRGPPRQRVRRGRDADPDQEHARRARATSSSRVASSRGPSTPCRRARSSSSSC